MIRFLNSTSPEAMRRSFKNRIKHVTSAVVFSLCLFFCQAVSAQSPLPISENTSSELQVVQGPIFSFEPQVQLTENYAGPVFASGGVVNFTGSTTQDLVVAGGTVQVSGRVEQDLYVAGGTVLLDGEVRGNVIAAGGHIKIGSTGQIGGSVIAASERLEVSPFLQKDSWLAGENIALYRGVNGNLNIAAESLFLAPSASIAGNLDAVVEAGKLDDQASVAGTRNIRTSQEKAPTSVLTEVFEFLYNLASRFLFLCVALLIFPSTIFAAAQKIGEKPLKSAANGMVLLSGIPLLSLLLLITALGIPVAVFFLVLYAAVILLSWTIPAMSIGKRVLPEQNQWLQAFAAVFVLSLLGLIPIVGTFVQIALVVVGVGSLWTLAREARSSLTAKK